jgi:SAM-dependent methyltransferase
MEARMQTSMDIAADAPAAFAQFLDELGTALDQIGLRFLPGPAGRITSRGQEIARVVEWRPGERVRFEWQTNDAAAPASIVLTFTARDTGTRVTVEVDDDGLIGDTDLPGWFASQVAAPLLQRLTPVALGDWITDRRARRPSGRDARATYADPLYHYPGFRVILEVLDLQPADRLLEIGCGGGAMLRQALESGCRAAAVDHSLDMVRLARSQNHDAVQQGRLALAQASGERVPFRNNTFTCAAMMGVLGFLPDPVAVFREIRRTLVPGGRFVALGSDPRLRGTPAAPEPMASRLSFYEDAELEDLGRAAGFTRVATLHRDLESFARDAGVPAEHVALFAGATSFLVAERD